MMSERKAKQKRREIIGALNIYSVPVVMVMFQPRAVKRVFKIAEKRARRKVGS